MMPRNVAMQNNTILWKKELWKREPAHLGRCGHSGGWHQGPLGTGSTQQRHVIGQEPPEVLPNRNTASALKEYSHKDDFYAFLY
jgi:hypothetical protein